MGCGEPVAATLVFSFVEVVAGFPNMTDNVADILLALVWTQYQYVLFPLVFGYVASILLLEDWKRYTRSISGLSASGDDGLGRL